MWTETKALLDQDDEPSYAAMGDDWRALRGGPPPGAADPTEVGVLNFADIVANPAPLQRDPVGPVGDLTAAEWISRHVALSSVPDGAMPFGGAARSAAVRWSVAPAARYFPRPSSVLATAR
ncbi:MAG: hypothetical protein M0Z54_11090 [Thermaerobacter sp.]|nr:hypothetical protein [Thermaerobacter sp.]